MRTILSGFATISEFTAGLNGDCGPTATLAALHQLDPARWPLTPAALKALDTDEISHGFAEANGAQNIPSLSGYLDRIGVAHTTYGYGACPLDLVHTTLQTLAGKKPILIEWANAGALPGDEPGVHFHFSTCGGLDTGPAGDGVGGGYLWCDGDNRADDPGGAPRPPVLYTWADISAAQPIAMVVFDGVGAGVIPMAWTQQADHSGRDGQGHTCGIGMMNAILANGLAGHDGRRSETYAGGLGPVRSFLTFAGDGRVLTWDGASVGFDGGDVVEGLAAQLGEVDAQLASVQTQLAAAEAEIAQLKNQPAPPPVPADPVALDAKATLAVLKKTLAELP